MLSKHKKDIMVTIIYSEGKLNKSRTAISLVKYAIKERKVPRFTLLG